MTRLSTHIRQLILLGILSVLAGAAFSAETITVKSKPTRMVVIELYTSEGCSSCPAADQWLEQLIRLPADELDVLALAFHVDYWDYIGWKDRFANPAYTNRQRHLARLNQQQSIYTPEFFVDGRETRGTRRILDSARKANQMPASVTIELSISLQNNQLQLELVSEFDAQQHPQLRFFVFEDKLGSQVDDGENAGRVLHHERVVRYFGNRQPLQPYLQQLITLNPDWQRNNLGVGALVQSEDGEYLQAVYSLLTP